MNIYFKKIIPTDAGPLRTQRQVNELSVSEYQYFAGILYNKIL